MSVAKYKGFALKIKYGKQFDDKELEKDVDYIEKWEKSLKEKEISFTNELEPGVWNKVELVISPAKSEELGHMVLSMQTNTLSFFEKQNKP